MTTNHRATRLRGHRRGEQEEERRVGEVRRHRDRKGVQPVDHRVEAAPQGPISAVSAQKSPSTLKTMAKPLGTRRRKRGHPVS